MSLRAGTANRSNFRSGSFVCIRAASQLGLDTGNKPTFSAERRLGALQHRHRAPLARAAGTARIPRLRFSGVRGRGVEAGLCVPLRGSGGLSPQAHPVDPMGGRQSWPTAITQLIPLTPLRRMVQVRVLSEA